MKNTFTMTLLGIVLSTATLSVQARNTKLLLPVEQAMKSEEAVQVLNPNITVQFSSGSGSVVKANVVTSRKTNAFGKSDEKACEWAFLSGVKQLQEKAHELGASRVINVVSYYNKKVLNNSKEYECHAGGLIAGVALKGDIAK